MTVTGGLRYGFMADAGPEAQLPEDRNAPSPRQAGTSDRGATLVEASIVIAIIAVPILLATIEFGLTFKDWISVSNASINSARVAASFGNNPVADIEALRSVETGMEAASLNQVGSITISDADNPGDSNTYNYTPLTGCKWTPCPDPDDPGYVPPSWPPSARSVTVGALDRVTVTIQFTHNYITGIFGSTVDLTRSATIRLEPQVFG